MHMISLCPNLMIFKSVSPLYKYSFFALTVSKNLYSDALRPGK